MKITKFDKQVAKDLRPQIDAELAALGQRLGITLTVGNCSFESQVAKFTLHAELVNADPEEVRVFKQLSGILGIPETALGVTFTYANRTWKLRGYNNRKRTRPWIAEDTRDGKTYCLGFECEDAIKAAVAAK